jgi:hypothetical protein
MAKCDILRCKNPLREFSMCDICHFKMCERCADNLVINGKQICPKCTFGGNFEGIFPGISNVRFSQDHGTGILSTHQGHYSLLSNTNTYKYAVYMTTKPNELILVFRLNDGQRERFMKFSLFINNDDLSSVMIKLHSPLNIKGEMYAHDLSLQDTFKPNVNPVFSSLTPKFKIEFDKFREHSIKSHFDTKPIFGVEWWRLMVHWYGLDYIDFGAAEAASPFRPKKSRRRSKSAKKRRNLKSKSKSKSKKGSR